MWNLYKENCLSGDFEGVQVAPYFTPNEHNESPCAIWAKLKHQEPQLFDEIIHNLHGCVTTDDAAEIVCIEYAYDDFIDRYGIQANKFLEKDLKQAAKDAFLFNGKRDECRDIERAFDEEACSALISNEIDKIHDDITFLCKDESEKDVSCRRLQQAHVQVPRE